MLPSYLVFLMLVVASQAEVFTFNVLQWNIFLRQTQLFNDGQMARLNLIPKYLAALNQADPIDVITFCEAWIHSDQLATALKSQGFNYSTKLLKDPNPTTSFTNGGVIVVSKHPILREDEMIYHGDCDFAAAKGVKYARVEKTNPDTGSKKIFNIFTTHMQAWDTNATHTDRRKQSVQFYNFVRANNLSPQEPVILTGDFNSDLGSWASETETLFKLLHAKMPQIIGYNYTIDPSDNVLVGRDGGADDCKTDYQKSWGPLVNDEFKPSPDTRVPCKQCSSCFCSCCPFQWLDYVLLATEFQQARAPPTLEVIKVSVPRFEVNWLSNQKMVLWDLSDHYPVLGKFQFDYVAPPITQDGCKNDDDCHFYFPYCYCSGSGCTLNGTVVDGRKYGPRTLINASCKFTIWNGQCACHFS